MIPVVFSGNRGWLYLPQASSPSRQAIVFFPPFGVEDLSTRHSLASLAANLADAGHPVLRFDLPGTGDALGDHTGISLNDWVEAGQQAIEALKQWSGSTSACLLGLRMGGLVATLVAQAQQQQGHPVSALALLAPVLDGRQHIRELRALANGGSPLTIAGFPINDALKQAIASVSPAQFAAPPAQQIFLGIPGSGKQLADLESQWRTGVPLLTVPYPDIAEHIGNPTMSRAPLEMFKQLEDWFNNLPLSTPRKIGNPNVDTTLVGEHFVEQGEMLAIENGLAAVWCTPARSLPQTPIVIFCNAGRNPHTGWARSSVALARHLAEQGITSLRFDLAGLGDSPRMSEQPAELLYSKAGIPQLRCVLDAVGKRHGHDTPICLVGSCSGGYLAFHAAQEDERISHLVLINVQRFIWEEGMSLQASMRTGGRSTQAYRQRAFSPETWKRLLCGDVNLGAVMKVLGLRAWNGITRSAMEKAGGLAKRSNSAGKSDTKTPATIREGFRRLASRGTQSVVIYSEEDGGRDEFARYFGANSQGFTRLPGTRLVIIPDADHDLTPLAARETLLSEILAACSPPKIAAQSAAT